MNDSENHKKGWEKQTLEKLAFSSVNEQRRARRWGIFFKSMTFIYLFILLFIGLGWFGDNGVTLSKKHTAIVDLRGEISANSASSADNVNEGLRNAFKDQNTQGVILRINSPGGSPVQSGYINEEIKRLRVEYPNIPLYAVIEDICTSGGYYVAVAADKIFVNKASIVGSIGALMNGFGFTGTMEKLGIERRLLTAGADKGFLDPFSPSNLQQQEYAQKMLNDIHQQFIQVVRKGRGKRLNEKHEIFNGIFSGIVWTGQKSIELGLTDALGSTDYVAREIIQAESIVDFTTKESFMDRFAKRLGSAATSALINASSRWKIQ
ncbi:MAG: S49 family peptidase [Nitrosomonadaceae bacterium]|nr:S49 family peptidase [Nitrosomonadaceae bacterium]|tara:strand:+ start:5282 stop:6244 length:963 start_codon:yes stop_codon:yes gene_type:complete